MRAVQSHGLRIRYETVGVGPTVILHHGGGFRLESWDLAGWVQPLATSHRVVTFDARGNGESDKPTEPQDYALELMVDDVLAVADACDTASFHYLGFSLGAKVGWGVAAWAQDRLESIALIGAEPEANEAISEEFTALLRQGMDAVAAAMSQMWQMPDWALDQQRRNNSEAQLAYFQAVWPDLSEVPTELRVPSLLICGTEDAVQDAMVRAARAGHLTLVTLDGADHMASFLSERARQAYQRFLRDVG